MLDEIRQIKEGGGFGSIVGRNSFQRPKAEGIALLQEMGAQTGIDVEQLIDAGRRAEEILGLRLRSNVILSGPVIHVESSPEKEPGAAVRAPA